MPGLANFRIPPPTKWQDFEDLCLDLWRGVWRDENTQKNGRRGQPQNGVDIFGRPDKGQRWAGVQCKGKDETLGSTLTNKELLAEVEKAKEFQPQLSSFTIVYTSSRDAALQTYARLLTEKHERQGLFSVHVWCWDDVLERLNDFPDVASVHFPHFHPVHILRAIPLKSSVPVQEASTLLDFASPLSGAQMLQRVSLCRNLEEVVATGCSVYINAPSGYGKSVLLSQLRLPTAAWIDCEQDNRGFTQFRQRLDVFLRTKYRVGATEEPQELARQIDKLVANSSEPRLVLILDHVDGVDNGVKAFIQDIVSGAANVRVIVAGSTFGLRRQHALLANGRLRLISATDLAFSEEDTIAVITAPLKDIARHPSISLGRLVSAVTDGWPIAVQLVRARLERDFDEGAAVRSLEEIGKQELGSYLLESYWNTLDSNFTSLLMVTSILMVFDYSDAQALMPGQNLSETWDDLSSLPFVRHFFKDPSLVFYQPMFRSFLNDRLAKERTPDEVRQLHRSATLQFLDAKHVPPGALHHAQLSGDDELVARAAGAMADYAFSIGSFPILKEVLGNISSLVRWNDPTLAVHQGRLYEHDHDLDNALKWYRHAQVLFDQQGPDLWRIGIVSDIGGILRKMGKLDEAISLYDNALDHLPPDEPSPARAQLLANRANVFLQRHSLQEAENGFNEAKHISELNRDASGLSIVYQGLAHVAHYRRQKEKAFDLHMRALRWSRRARNASLFVPIAAAIGEGLIKRGKYRSAHRVYQDALKSAAASDSPELLPFLLTNFGLACAFLPEPDQEGVGALLAAREMKRAARLRRGSTLQNLSVLLMRLGEFRRALPIVREQEEVAKETNDQGLANDAKAKLAELESYLAASPMPALSEGGPHSRRDRYSLPARRFMVEGRVRANIRLRWPLLRDIIAVQPSEQEDIRIAIGQDTFELREAQTVLCVVRDKARWTLSAPSAVTVDQNLILELIWENEPTRERPTEPDDGLAAIWWVRNGKSVWIQCFWHETGERAGVTAMKGSLFELDLAKEEWVPAEHPEGCKCGRTDVHERARNLANALVESYSTSPHKDVVIAHRKYTAVVSVDRGPEVTE